MQIGIIAVACRQHQHEKNKKHVNKGCGNDLDDRQNTDLKNYLLDQIIIFQKRIRTVCQRLRKIKPGHQSRCQIQDKGHINSILDHFCLRIKAELKNDPIDQNRNDRLDHGPDHAHIGTRIAGLKIIFCQLPDQLPVLPEFYREHRDLVKQTDKQNLAGCNDRTGNDLFDALLPRVCKGIVVQHKNGRHRQGAGCENTDPGLLAQMKFFPFSLLFHMVNLTLFRLPALRIGTDSAPFCILVR